MSTRPKPYYSSQATLKTNNTNGGAGFSGGTLVDVDRLKAAQATSGKQTVGGTDSDERGLPAGTYHLQFSNPGSSAAIGVYKLFWEERP